MGLIKKISSIVFTVAACLLVCNMEAQQIERALVGSAGNQVFTEGVKLEWSVGEGVVSQFSTNDYRLTQGLHQGTSLINEVYTLEGWQNDIVIAPNPVSNNLYLLKKETEQLQFDIFDTVGQLVGKGTWNDISKTVNVAHLTNGLYMILIKNEQGTVAVFRFIKQS